MDLYAYSQIDRLEEIAKEHGIEVPRLRGYRLMSEETMLTKIDIDEALSQMTYCIVESLCESIPFWSESSSLCVYSTKTQKIKKRYIDEDTYEIRWENIHGRKRRVLKFAIKKAKKKVIESFDTFNKYVGENVLLVHSRIGGNNWDYYGGDELRKKLWFLDKADDWFDDTYCDIYARL